MKEGLERDQPIDKMIRDFAAPSGDISSHPQEDRQPPAPPSRPSLDTQTHMTPSEALSHSTSNDSILYHGCPPANPLTTVPSHTIAYTSSETPSYADGGQFPRAQAEAFGVFPTSMFSYSIQPGQQAPTSLPTTGTPDIMHWATEAPHHQDNRFFDPSAQGATFPAMSYPVSSHIMPYPTGTSDYENVGLFNHSAQGATFQDFSPAVPNPFPPYMTDYQAPTNFFSLDSQHPGPDGTYQPQYHPSQGFDMTHLIVHQLPQFSVDTPVNRLGVNPVSVPLNPDTVAPLTYLWDMQMDMG
jgi:hypothetical protein